MPKPDTKSTSSRPQLHAVRTPKQWDKFDQQINSIVRQLTNGDDENARSLVVLANMISDEQGVDQVNLLDKIARAAFLQSCDFDDVFQSWEREVLGIPLSQIRKRA